MNCILNAFELFKTNTCQASVIAVAAFVLGAIAMCLLCKVGCSCGRGQGCSKSCVAKLGAKKGE